MYKILAVGPAWIGDTVLAQPLFRRLREAHDDLVLDVFAPPWTFPVLRRMPEVSSVLNNPFAHGELNVAGRFAFAHQLRDSAYDQAVVLPNSFKSALLPWFARIPLRTGYVGEFRYVLLNDARRLDVGTLPLMVERYAALGQSAATPLVRPLPQPRLTTSPVTRAAVLARLAIDAGTPLACLCPGAEYGPAKRWPEAYFAQLASRLVRDGYRVVTLGSSKDREIGDKIAQLSNGAAIDLCGETTLDEAVDLLACARLCVSNDSGLMHVAAAVGVPLLALYGSSSPAFTPPLSETAQILKLDLACSPCFQRVCPLQHFNCMMQLTPDRVYAALGNLDAAAHPMSPAQ
ncbi:MAG: lipopolysaccharide heptosyltransferase II [Betaproteobacteria bacterium]